MLHTRSARSRDGCDQCELHRKARVQRWLFELRWCCVKYAIMEPGEEALGAARPHPEGSARNCVSREDELDRVNVSNGNRILFLDSLRAIAVLLVVWGHVMLVGINDPATVHNWVPSISLPIFGQESVANNAHGQLGLVIALSTGVNPGGLGVALFFLISGFVIVRSVERVTWSQFLVQRFFRIIPTCFVAVLLVVAAMWLIFRQAGAENPNSLTSVLTSTFALNFYNGAFSAIPVLWTLEVEMAFYLVVAFLAALPGRITTNRLMHASAACVLLVALAASPATLHLDASTVRLLQHWSSILVHISFMLVGSLIHRMYVSERWWRLLPHTAIALVSYWVALTVLLSATSQREIGASLHDCIAALGIFVAGLLAGMRGKWLKPLRWVGDISYPLYLLHVPLAWMLLVAFAGLRIGMNAAGALSIAAVVLLSWLVHRSIELPSQDFGKRIAKRLPVVSVRKTVGVTDQPA